MGIIGGFLAEAAAKAVGKAAALEIGGRIQDKRNSKEAESEKTYIHKLVIEERDFTIARSFHVVDESGKAKYRVKTDRFKIGMPTIHLYDRDKNEIGRITQKRELFAARSWNDYYSVFINEQKVGTIVSKPSIKTKLMLDLNGWQLKGGGVIAPEYVICDANGEEILKILADNNIGDEYALFYNNPADEIPGLLLMMTVDLIMHPKGDKSTFLGL